MPDVPLPNCCGETWTWCISSGQDAVFDSETGALIFHPRWSHSTDAVRGTVPLNGAIHYWELELQHPLFGTSVMFGVGTGLTKLRAPAYVNILGQDQNSWGLSYKGDLWHAGQCTGGYMEPVDMASTESSSTVIGLRFDGLQGTLTYYRDGKALPVAFRNIPVSEGPIYPMIASTAVDTRVTLRNRHRCLTDLQDRCRSVIRQSIASRDALNTLPLPHNLLLYLQNV